MGPSLFLHPGAKYNFPFSGNILRSDPEGLVSGLYYVKATPGNFVSEFYYVRTSLLGPYLDSIIRCSEILRISDHVHWKILIAYGNWKRYREKVLNHLPARVFACG